MLSISNLLICGYSSVAYDALFLGVQPLRIFSSLNPQVFDSNEDMITVNNIDQLKKMLNRDFFPKIKNSFIKKLKKNQFYKLDNKANLRFWNFVEKIQIS